LISFTFDDFPKSALSTGGEILRRYQSSGTYYVSLGILGLDSPSGKLCERDDLVAALEQGHELGCHTFAHCHSWNTSRENFRNAILENRDTMNRLIPGTEFKSMSYPQSEPSPGAKLEASKHFLCCRSGGQSINTGIVDANQLFAFFLEKRRDSIQEIKDLIDRNRAMRGWTIFGTHDVSANPSPYGCSPAFFEEVVSYAKESGAVVLPVARAFETLAQEGHFAG
jgi:peptidoglycan/xylan/chitin deacetylase (PgdA/CDA1 family)